MNNKVQRTFIPGDEWLYYKIYCGVKMIDFILTDLIKPITEELLKQKLIDEWFFIRYSDPDSHLRVRFHISKTENLARVILGMNEKLSFYLESNQVWDIQLLSYQRELERYGSNTIEDAESYFFYDSELVLNGIKNSNDDESRFLNILKLVENSLTLFNYDNERRLSFLNKMQLQFKSEFSVNKTVKKELSNKYRELQSQLFENDNYNDSPLTIYKHLQIIVDRLLMLEKENKLEISLENLLASFIHMTINRGFRSKQRLYEMMIYDFLYKKNNSKFARNGST